MYLGAHLGIAKGLDVAASEAERIGCESLQIFAKSPQMWKGPPISPEAAAGFRAAVVAHRLRATAVHHGYLLNLAHPSDARRAQSERAFRDELDRAELLGVDALIFHPGAHLGSGVEAGVARIADALNAAIAATPTYRVRALLENSAGQGTTIGSRFEELAEVLDRISRPDRVGVTLDTCHLFAAGFDFRTPEGYGEMMNHVRGTIRIERVRAVHLNDSKSDLGSHLDRHENIGAGKIGREAFRALINDPRWAAVPGFLETPLDDDDYVRYARDLQTLRSLLSRPRKTAARRSSSRRASTIK